MKTTTKGGIEKQRKGIRQKSDMVRVKIAQVRHKKS